MTTNKIISPEKISGLSYDDQPIAALSSGFGACAVGVIRLTGLYCHELISQICPLDPTRVEARKMYLTEVTSQHKEEPIDSALVVFFRNPASFTGQDSAEIQCHGGPYIIKRILDELFSIGFRAADPGEFTKRAFLNEKLDLTSAEGIKELVEAKSHQQWKSAKELASGKLLKSINALRSSLLEGQAFLEAQIDFPDEGDTQSAHLAQVTQPCIEARKTIENLLASYDSGRISSQGLRVALLGAPNAGKSSLMNYFLGEDRAIVTDEAGTTRDFLEEECLISGALINLIDTAGIRQTEQKVEKIGIQRSLQIAEEADVVVYLVSPDCDPSENQKITSWLESQSGKNDIVSVFTKSDKKSPYPSTPFQATSFTVSTKTGEGIDKLEEHLKEKVSAHVNAIEENPFITTPRQRAALIESQKFLDQFLALAKEEPVMEECLSFELWGAIKSLGNIIGTLDNEDVLDKVFTSFCIGK